MKLIKNGKFWTVKQGDSCLYMSLHYSEALSKIGQLRGVK